MAELRFAFKQTIPIFFTYLFIGIAFGVMMAEAGYGAGWSLFASVFVFAGSLQIAMVSLLQAGAPLLTVAVMTFFINARHIFYGVGFVDKFRKMGWKAPYMVLSLTDETYSVLCSVRYDAGLDEHLAAFFIAALNHSYWVLGSVLGGLAGRLLPWDMRGIDFSATAFFLVVVINQWQQFRSKVPALTGLVSALLFYVLLGPDRFLIPALSVSMVVLVILKDRFTLANREEGNA